MTLVKVVKNTYRVFMGKREGEKGKKVKITLVQALRLCTGRTAHRGSRGIDLLFHDHGTRRGWGVSVTPRPLFTPGKVPVPIVQEAGWAPGQVWTGAENFSRTGNRSPDRPARIHSIYWLRYPAHVGRETIRNFLDIWKDNIEMDLKEIVWAGLSYIYLA